MRNAEPWTLVGEASPPRQGFYEAQTADGRTLIAEWRERDKQVGKQWWQHVADDPQVAKQPVPLAAVRGWRKAPKAEVAAYLKREPTTEEHVQHAYAQYVRSERITPGLLVPPPANRQLAVGDALELGNLRKAKVAALFEEGRVVVLAHRSIATNYGKELDQGIAYMARPWYDVVPKATIKTTDLVVEPVIFAYSNSTLDSVCNKVMVWDADDNPDYQRDYVWSEDDRIRFLDSVFAGRELGRFIFVRWDYPRRDDVLDGKQRLKTLVGYMTSQYSYRGYFWHELSQHDRRNIEGRMVQYAELPGKKFTRVQLLRIFLEVNAAGVPQTEAHLAHVRQLLAEEQLREAGKSAR